jgi:Uncharacterized protein conserved in bacteria (DUF2330)
MRRLLVSVLTLGSVMVAGPAWACAGLVAPNGSVELVRTTTLSAYHDGVEHYITSFEFSKAKGTFGSIVPLPGVPTDIAKAGRWTLQRLQQEVQPPVAFALAEDAAAPSPVEILQQTQVGALDITVVKGGGSGVARWAQDNGFSLTPDAPEVLDYYADRSPIFMAVKYDATRAAKRGLTAGDGTPVHLTIPTDDPWVPLRILALGQEESQVVEADVFLLTDEEPNMLPNPVSGARVDVAQGLLLRRSEPASDLLLSDLRSDRGMRWLPSSGMWFTYLQLRQDAGDLLYDLAIDPTGRGAPSPVDAGLATAPSPVGADRAVLWITAALLIGLGAMAMVERRRAAAA